MRPVDVPKLRLPHAHPHVHAHAPFRGREICESAASSTSARHLKESAVPNTCPEQQNQMQTVACEANSTQRHLHCPPTPLSLATFLRGRFGTARAQRGHSAGTAPIITLFIPGTPLKTAPLQTHA